MQLAMTVTFQQQQQPVSLLDSTKLTAFSLNFELVFIQFNDFVSILCILG